MSNHAYYTPETASIVKAWITQLLTGKQPIFILPQEGTSMNTLRVQYYQGRKYLKNYESEFSKCFNAISCKALPDRLLITFRPNFSLAQATVAVHSIAWKTEVEDFLETSTYGTKLYRNDLCLTQDDLQWVLNAIAPFGESIITDLSPTSILLIKHDSRANTGNP